MVITNQEYAKMRYAALDRLWACCRSASAVIGSSNLEGLSAARSEAMGKFDLGYMDIRAALEGFAGFLSFIPDLLGDLEKARDNYLETISKTAEIRAYELLNDYLGI